MEKLVRIAFLILCAVPAAAQGITPGSGRKAVHYTEKNKIDSSRRLTIKYDSLYPDLHFNFNTKHWMVGSTDVGDRGGCSFQDTTDESSIMPILEDKADHITIGAPMGHVVEWHCNWIRPNK